MDTSGKSLLSKWSLKDTGIKSSLISTGLQSNVSGGKSSGFESKLSAGPQVGSSLSTTRKRKPLTTKSSIEDKKPLVEKPHLKSSLLGSSLLTSGSLKSSLLGSSTLSSKTPPPSSLSCKTQTRSSHVTPQSRPLSGSLLGNTAATSLLSGYTTSALSSTLSAGRSLQGQDTSLTNQKVSVLSHASVLTNQQPVGGVSLQSSFLMTPSKLPTGLSDSKPKGTKEKSGQSQAKQKSKKRAADDRLEFDKYKAKAPRYDLRKVIPEEKGVEVPKFVNPSKDPSLNRPAIPLHDVNGLKLALINAVSGSLICQPDFSKSNDLTRRALSEMSERVVTYDPEFILKVALYTRKELNIRTTANFLLALCSNVEVCRPYLKKYYCASIQLPSDWIEVAEIYQAFHDTNLSHGSLPAALRKAMIMKFPEFDQYQLAKYNKESSMKKKKKKEKKETESVRGRGGHAGVRGRGGRGGVRGRGGAMRGRDARNVSTNQRGNWDSDSDEESDEEENIHRQLSDVVYDEEDHTQEEMEKIKFSIKQLIRKLHIIEPVDHVMSIIGKKYPDTLEAFYKSRLPGEWDQDRAGKRMKLPVPETWETQVSLKGNKASTWEDLIDHKKLPFMAMLRNLRNLIKAGISQKHHQQVLRRLTDERQVANSKQFPFRFFSAYEVLSGLEKEYETTQKKLVELAEMEASGISRSQVAPRGGRGRGRGRGRGGKGDNWWIEKKNKQKEEKKKPKETAFDKAIINRYKKALDTAVKIATVYNVQPIRGRTIVLSDCSDRMRVNCTAARGLGKPRQMLEVALLMGLMCKYSCEECEFVTFKETTWEQASVQPGTILDNLDNLLKKINFPEVSGKTEKMPNGFPESILMEKLRDRIQVDNIVILSGGDLAATQQKILSNFLKKYRQIVNPNLLYVNISFAGKGCGFSQSIKPEHDNDIYISGYSDAIL
ncbi:telomerase component p80-like, partial [Saccostrea cucullata]|uniref:telomerase component p80-like n=1 Tax=Saccostrea cuccullata TaxID=36930 RepID=UPI002ED34808